MAARKRQAPKPNNQRKSKEYRPLASYYSAIGGERHAYKLAEAKYQKQGLSGAALEDAIAKDPVYARKRDRANNAYAYEIGRQKAFEEGQTYRKVGAPPRGGNATTTVVNRSSSVASGGNAGSNRNGSGSLHAGTVVGIGGGLILTYILITSKATAALLQAGGSLAVTFVKGLQGRQG